MHDFNSTTPKGGAHTKSQIWLTPPHIIEQLGGFETFDLDPCGYLVNNNPMVWTAKEYFTESDDGLKQDWYGRVFCNPPYNNLGEWLEKMSLHGNGIVLCFCRTDTKAFNKYVKTATGINMIKGRVKFLNERAEQGGPANAASCLIAWGEDNYQLIKNIEGIYCRIDSI
jgi:hypothetical protein